jgi:hypothetical protein
MLWLGLGVLAGPAGLLRHLEELTEAERNHMFHLDATAKHRDQQIRGSAV